MRTQEKGTRVLLSDSTLLRYSAAFIPFSAALVPLPAPTGTRKKVSSEIRGFDSLK